MPRYGFRCLKCGREFEVSRPMSRADEPAACILDGSECERVISMPMTFVKSDPSSLPSPPSRQQGGGQWSHFGHSHGPGAAGHSHGPFGH